MLNDIRRLTGVNFLMHCPGAAAEAEIDAAQKGVAMAFWRRRARELLDAVGWQDETIAMRAFDGGATLMISAPMDALYTATVVVEKAWAAAECDLKGDAAEETARVAKKLKTLLAKEQNAGEVALAEAAAERGVTFLGYDKEVSVGLGTGSKTWGSREIPSVETIDWHEIHDVPIAMVTGTNGKSTTVRLAAAIGTAAGRTVGMSSSDWVRVGADIIDEGDYSGPAGARLAVRDNRVGLAIIETARGGLMRRGLPVPQADACLITNIAADHLGGYGIMDVPALADTKFLLAKAVKPGGRLILNGDDEALVSRSATFGGDITWYGLSLDQTALNRWIATGGHAVFVEDGFMTLARNGERTRVMPVANFVPGMGGAAKFNVSNALGAIGLASALGLPNEAMTKGLSSFKGTPDENPGRGNFMEIGGATVLVELCPQPARHRGAGRGGAGPSRQAAAVPGRAGRRPQRRGHARDDPGHLGGATGQGHRQGVAGENCAVAQPESYRRLSSTSCKNSARPKARYRLPTPNTVRCGWRWSGRSRAIFWCCCCTTNANGPMAFLDRLTSRGWQAGDPVPD